MLALLISACGESPRRAGWLVATSRDGTVALELPRSYQREGTRDYWVASAADGASRRFRLWRGPTAMRDPARPPGFPEPIGPWENGCGAGARATDVGCIVDRSKWQGQVNGRSFVIETGRLEGAMSSARVTFGVRAQWLQANGDTVGLEGAASDSTGLAELRRIATTLRPASQSARPNER